MKGLLGTWEHRMEPFLREYACHRGEKVAVEDFDLTGIANLAELPGIRGLVFSMIEGALAKMIVLPNRIAIPLGKRDDMEDPTNLYYPPPGGLLKVKVKKASNLPSHDWLDKSDPFVTVKVGHFAKEWKSQVKWDKANPEWDEVSKVFPIYAMCQKVDVAVFDRDHLSWHDEIGEIRHMEVQEAITMKEMQDHQLYDASGKEIPDAFVHLGFDWKAIKELVVKPVGEADDLHILSVAIEKIRPEKEYKLKDELTLTYRIDADGEANVRNANGLQAMILDSFAAWRDATA
ncbi:ESYT3 [Symbiodinium natans]|uniref:ESYT3 protein n=1 Tax=Symbiodinium natans TaxID=878477 RepID=A0A812R9Q4_9DINO|nr:ESYT3 [Symbiodinium natans]